MKFTVYGEPQAKARVRVTRTHAYTPTKTSSYENYVRLAYKAAKGDFKTGSIGIDVKAYFKIPKKTTKKNRLLMISQMILPTKKPDWDNVGKIISDALNGIAYDDDSQIVDGRVRKYYSEEPRVEVEIWEV